ncbi:hypothetical protein G4D61_12835 [Bacillus ginsengihumi]|uniref:Uncharacterized protein n=1 Tax=Heyndrickxia ginsengihumi TaxID=363870 RepID=A0A6M0PA70_9BACI|nr:hypothetical protein [Heyndrickxia ginsengihumi]NEY20839.1 hypothetical protein [Heyndrickxia ginsengihumi]
MYPYYYNIFPPYPTYTIPYRQYPSPDTNQFMNSAMRIHEMMNSAQTIVNHIARSKDFSTRLMNAAQGSNIAEVNRLVKSIQTPYSPIAHFSPDGLVLTFFYQTKAHPTPDSCCQLQIKMRWI